MKTASTASRWASRRITRKCASASARTVAVGVAGENVIVDTDRHVTWDEMAPGCAVLDAGGRELVRLKVLQPAHPCRPFTGWALGGQVEAGVLKEHLQFLDDGMRGYYAVAEGSAVLEAGMVLALL